MHHHFLTYSERHTAATIVFFFCYVIYKEYLGCYQIDYTRPMFVDKTQKCLFWMY
jgi:hypothetical protein